VRVVTFVIIITKCYKFELHRAVNTSQSSQEVILMYCFINKQGVINFRSMDTVHYELACANVAQCNTPSYSLLKSVNILVLLDKPIIAQGNIAIVSCSLCMWTVYHQFEPSRNTRSI